MKDREAPFIDLDFFHYSEGLLIYFKETTIKLLECSQACPLSQPSMTTIPQPVVQTTSMEEALDTGSQVETLVVSYALSLASTTIVDKNSSSPIQILLVCVVP